MNISQIGLSITIACLGRISVRALMVVDVAKQLQREPGATERKRLRVQSIQSYQLMPPINREDFRKFASDTL
jgi:hypothetical protein